MSNAAGVHVTLTLMHLSANSTPTPGSHPHHQLLADALAIRTLRLRHEEWHLAEPRACAGTQQ